MNWSKILNALLLVRFGQELGTDSPLTRAIRDVVTALISLVKG